MAIARKNIQSEDNFLRAGSDATATFDNSPSNPTEHVSSESPRAPEVEDDDLEEENEDVGEEEEDFDDDDEEDDEEDYEDEIDDEDEDGEDEEEDELVTGPELQCLQKVLGLPVSLTVYDGKLINNRYQIRRF